MFALLTDSFFLMSLAASFLVAIASGTMGSYVVVNRIAFIAGGISHAVLGGMGCCLWLQRVHGITWLSATTGAFIAAIGSAFLMGWIHTKYRQREDAVIAAIWSTGMAIGVIFLSLTPGTNVDLLGYLFGNILWISWRDLGQLALLDGGLLVAIGLFYRKLLALCFDEEQALLQNVRVRSLYTLLLSLVAVSVVLLIQMIGTVLLIAMLALPSMIASLFARRLSTLMLMSTALSLVLSASGLVAAYSLDWPPGATIALLAALSYLVVLTVRRRARLAG